MGHHHGHPLIGAMELRPDHWSATLKVSPRDLKVLCTDTDQHTYTTRDLYIHCTQGFNPKPITKLHCSYVESLPTCYSRSGVRCFSSCQPYQSFTNHQDSLLLIPSLWPHTHICNQLIIYKSCRDHANFHANPSFVIQESYHIYLILHYIHITHHAFIPNQNRPFKDKQIFNHSTVSPSTSLRLRDLTQARQSRLGEPPPRLGERAQKQGQEQRGISLKRDPSRLGELPARSKVERVAWATFRAKKPGRAPCFISPRRDGLAWAKLTGLATVLHYNSHVFRPNNTCKVLSHLKTTYPTIQSTNNA